MVVKLKNLNAVAQRRKITVMESRVCQTNLKIEYGNAKSCINLFKPSLRSDTFGVVWAERLREVVGINGNSFPGFLQLGCSVCARKIKNCCELVEFLFPFQTFWIGAI